MRTALLVIGYNRPEATARLLEALSADEATERLLST